MKQAIKQHYEAGDDRRRQIASAARKLIAEKGFEGLRTREIADAVGINVATMHYHVPNKEALIVLIAESLGEELEADRAAMRRDGPPLELFEAPLVDPLEHVLGQRVLHLDEGALGDRDAASTCATAESNSRSASSKGVDVSPAST